MNEQDKCVHLNKKSSFNFITLSKGVHINLLLALICNGIGHFGQFCISCLISDHTTDYKTKKENANKTDSLI